MRLRVMPEMRVEAKTAIDCLSVLATYETFRISAEEMRYSLCSTGHSGVGAGAVRAIVRCVLVGVGGVGIDRFAVGIHVLWLALVIHEIAV